MLSCQLRATARRSAARSRPRGSICALSSSPWALQVRRPGTRGDPGTGWRLDGRVARPGSSCGRFCNFNRVQLHLPSWRYRRTLGARQSHAPPDTGVGATFFTCAYPPQEAALRPAKRSSFTRRYSILRCYDSEIRLLPHCRHRRSRRHGHEWTMTPSIRTDVGGYPSYEAPLAVSASRPSCLGSC
jgi:hypothetical protein